MSDHLDEMLDSLGTDVAAAQDRVLEARPLPVRADKPRRPYASVALVAVAAAAVLVFVLRPAEPLSFQVDGSPGEIGEWTEGHQLLFSDGTEVELEPSTAARVLSLEPEGAAISLERGTARAQVVHRDEETRWSVAAGPFLVRVIGTAFTVRWEPDERVLRLHTEEGVVELSGPVLPEATRVRAGQSVTVDLSEQRAEVREGVEREEAIHPAVEPAEHAELVPSPEMANETAEPPEPASEETPSRRPRVQPETPRWQDLASEARHADAIAAIDTTGLQNVLNRSNAGDMLLLGDTLRAARDARAPQVYRRLRAQFPSTRPAARAAFMLGRMLQARDPAAAVAHYRSCLQEDPGPLRREAHGRLVEALAAANDTNAPAEARRYLSAYPDGPHAPFAASLLN